MDKIRIILVITVFGLSSLFFGWVVGKFGSIKNQPGTSKTNLFLKPRPLEKYTFDNLLATQVQPGKITLVETLNDEATFSSSLFKMDFNPNLDGKTTKATTGLITFPKAVSDGAKFPLVVMLRGYVNQPTYQTGTGTKRAGEYFAQNGVITVAPDFLGYAGSDAEAGNIFETRFQTYVTVLALLKALDQIPNWDGKNIFLWGHSNGGQVALTILAVSNQSYPTTLWAPVSKPFPYSILYYTDESDDGGKFIRRELAAFEEDYDTDNYSLTTHLDNINQDIPIQVHQGGEDDAVPPAWSISLVKQLQTQGLKAKYYYYPTADHNLQPSWNSVVQRDLDFFRRNTVN